MTETSTAVAEPISTDTATLRLSCFLGVTCRPGRPPRSNPTSPAQYLAAYAEARLSLPATYPALRA